MLIPIVREDAEAVAEPPLHHHDPFDRMMIAQARRLRATFVTADRWAQAYDVDVLAADR